MPVCLGNIKKAANTSKRVKLAGDDIKGIKKYWVDHAIFNFGLSEIRSHQIVSKRKMS